MGSLTPQAALLLEQAADEALAGADVGFLKGSSLLVTGATGLVGGALVRAVLRGSARQNLGVTVVLPMRNPSRAGDLFPASGGATRVVAVEWPDLLAPLEAPKADYAVHAAAMTASLDMARRPADTLVSAFESARSFLAWARRAQARKVLFLSSLEMYGAPRSGHPDMAEGDSGHIDPMLPRSSYSEGKRAAETLCAAFAAQHGVPACVARLAQTFGPGAAPGDRRACAQFAHAALAGEDIVLHTAGRTAHNYCHVSDAVAALLVLLQRGVAGEAYNIAREDSYATIRELATRFAEQAGAGSRVVCDQAGAAAFGYAPEVQIRLLTDKLAKLGHRARLGLPRMVDDLLAWYRALSHGAGAGSPPTSERI